MNCWINPPKPKPLVPYGPRYHELILNPSWVLEPKLNGQRCLTWLTEQGVRSFTRTGSRLLRLTQALHGMKWPETLVLDGEYYEGKYHVFDLYRAGGNLDTRYRQLAHVVRQFSADHPIQIMPRWEKIGAYERALDAGYEGIVLKSRAHLYNMPPFNQKDPLWRKVKP